MYVKTEIEKDLVHHHVHGSAHDHSHHHQNEGKVRAVVYISAAVMVLEIFFGYYTNSMALLADGWHMASHVLAIGLSWVAYYIARKNSSNSKFTTGTGKILSLSGYTSAIILLVVAVLILIESINRIMHPEPIRFADAITVAIIGLIVNAVCARFLHHDHEHSDHNIRAAYVHVLADLLTSITAIFALIAGYYWNIIYLDTVGGILSSLVITHWAYGLIKTSGKELLDYK